MHRGNNTRRAGTALVTLALLVLASAMAGAQGSGRFGGGPFGGGQGGLQMLRLPEVQKELAMTPAEIGKLDAAQQTVSDGMQALPQPANGYMNMTPAERQARADSVQDLNDKAAATVLDATQLKRYHELSLQRQGGIAILHKTVGTALALTDAQQKSLTDIQTQADTDRRALLQSGGGFQGMSPTDRQALFAKMQTLQTAEGDKIVALLTDAQKAQWKTMQGTPFTFPAPPGAPAPAAPATPAPATPGA